MIVAIVRFKLPAGTDVKKAAALYEQSAPRFQGMPGLVRKYYLFDAATGTGGGCYLWESREAADRCYSAEFRASIKARYGAEPEISYLEAPVIVDNESGKITTAAA